MVTIRPLERSDDEQITSLWVEGFGEWEQTGPPVNPIDRPGRHGWCAVDDGRLVATVADREFDSWFGGAMVPTAGIASVAVQAEARGTGLLTPLFEQMLGAARERGALISTLYPTAPGIYRRFGYAPITALEDLRVPTHALAVRGDTARHDTDRHDTAPTRRATADDMPAIRSVHARWAAEQNGPLTRTGVSFPDSDADVLAAVTGYTVAESSPGQVSGYASWSRGKGYGAEASIRVWDLIADDPASLASLMNVLASFASVAPSTVIRTSGTADWQHLLRSGPVQSVKRDDYMLAVLDVAVLERLTYPEGLELGLPFSWNGRGHFLSVEGQRGHVESADVPGARVLDAAGLALVVSGAQRSAALRRLGHLTGDASHDVYWDTLFGIRQPHVRDYF